MSSSMHEAPAQPRATQSTLRPVLCVVVATFLTALILHAMGRRLSCACGTWTLWAGDIWTQHNSQHVADPYSFTHVLHGVLFCGLITWLFPRLSTAWKWAPAALLELTWEVLENSPYIIDRYREATVSLGYEGDSIINSISDVAFCSMGFFLAHALGFRRSVIFFILVELILLVWIRDNLALNILMLIAPIDAIKTWQMVH